MTGRLCGGTYSIYDVRAESDYVGLTWVPFSIQVVTMPKPHLRGGQSTWRQNRTPPRELFPGKCFTLRRSGSHSNADPPHDMRFRLHIVVSTDDGTSLAFGSVLSPFEQLSSRHRRYAYGAYRSNMRPPTNMHSENLWHCSWAAITCLSQVYKAIVRDDLRNIFLWHPFPYRPPHLNNVESLPNHRWHRRPWWRMCCGSFLRLQDRCGRSKQG